MNSQCSQQGNHLKLHLGCGVRRFPSYVNIDIDPLCEPDIVSDIDDLPYEESTVDEILCIHAIEHLYLDKVFACLAYWRKLLKPGGKLIIECPDAEKIFQVYRFVTMEARERPELHGFARIINKWMFGHVTPDHPSTEWMRHKSMLTTDYMLLILEQLGYSKAEVKDPIFHGPRPQRDMRIEATK